MVHPIPRIIHQMWIPPEGWLDQQTVSTPAHHKVKLPADVEENVLSWDKNNPGYLHYVWSEAEVKSLCILEDRLDVWQAIDACRFPSMRADVARLFLLLVFGGWWADLKLKSLLPIDPGLHYYKCVLAEYFPQPVLPDPTGVVVNGFIGSAPGFWLIKNALKIVLDNIQTRQPLKVVYLTGSFCLQAALSAERYRRGHLPVEVHLLPHASTWNRLFLLGSGSYNTRHWSERQWQEPLLTPAISLRPMTGKPFFPNQIIRPHSVPSENFLPTDTEAQATKIARFPAAVEITLAYPVEKIWVRLGGITSQQLNDYRWMIQDSPCDIKMVDAGEDWFDCEIVVCEKMKNHISIAVSRRDGCVENSDNLAIFWFTPGFD